jgi:DNA topoisomerase VI subunit A
MIEWMTNASWCGMDVLPQDVDDECFKPLTPRDKAMISSLKATLSDWEGWVTQLAEMESCDVKADIEALYSSGGYSGLSQMLASRILQHNYIT